jgi:hypothetical protein
MAVYYQLSLIDSVMIMLAGCKGSKRGLLLGQQGIQILSRKEEL